MFTKFVHDTHTRIEYRKVVVMIMLSQIVIFLFQGAKETLQHEHGVFTSCYASKLNVNK